MNDPDPDPKNYSERLYEAQEKVKFLEGTKVFMSSKKPRLSMTWTVVEKHVCPVNVTPPEAVGLRPEVLSEVFE